MGGIAFSGAAVRKPGLAELAALATTLHERSGSVRRQADEGSWRRGCGIWVGVTGSAFVHGQQRARAAVGEIELSARRDEMREPGPIAAIADTANGGGDLDKS